VIWLEGLTFAVQLRRLMMASAAVGCNGLLGRVSNDTSGEARIYHIVADSLNLTLP
jgi:hypothetical protein